MRKKIINLILVMITIINIIAATFIFFDIQILQAPETTISIDIIEINSDEAIIQTTIDIDNPNSFKIITKDLEIVIITPDGDQIAHMKIDGGHVPPNEKKTFTETFVIDFNDNSPGLLTTRLTGKLGMKTGFIQKTILLAINVVTSVEDVIKQLAPPIINIKTDFREMTQERINISGVIDVYNPNTFDISIENISLEIKTDTGKNVGNLVVDKGTIIAKSSLKLNAGGEILLESLNAETLTINMSAIATAKIADFNKSLPLYVEVEMEVPDLETLLSPDPPLGVIIKTDFKASIKGLIIKLLLEVHNPSKIVLVGEDILVSIYSVNKEEKRLISKCDLEEGIIKAESVTFLRGEMIVPYFKLLPQKGEKIIPDGILVMVRGKAAIQGINQSIWLEVGGYQDLRPFREYINSYG
jgi:LEA14-like dessication related protein